MKQFQATHCDACGREIMNVKDQDVIRELESYAIVVCTSCSHHQNVYYKDGGNEKSK